MEQVITAFYMTMELWIFVGILALALGVEEFVAFMQRRADRQQILINLEVDRLAK
jgi:hypothetical protein